MHCAAFSFDVRRGEPLANLAEVERGLARAHERGIELVLLPEMWPTSFPTPESDWDQLREASELCRLRLIELCRQWGMFVGGSMFHFGGELPCNRFELMGPLGPMLGYDKVHLFSPTAEPASFAPGGAPPGVAELPLGKVSAVVCYDLRFVELLRVPWLAGTELLLVPCQWPNSRAAQLRALALGTAAWMQAYVLVCNRVGTERVGRRGLELEFGGGSLLVDPRGRVLAEGQAEPGLIHGQIDWDDLRALRREIPVGRDRCPKSYAAPRAEPTSEDTPESPR